jgi:hypothetical protein
VNPSVNPNVENMEIIVKCYLLDDFLQGWKLPPEMN